MNKLLISVSGGRSSAVMAHHIATHEKYRNAEKLFVFANTGKEREETYTFLNAIDKAWNLNLVWIEAVANLEMGKGIEYKIVDYHTADRKGQPFEQAIMHMTKNPDGTVGVPNQEAPYCSKYTKELPINRFAKEMLGAGYISAIGFRAEDMPKRVTWAEIAETKTHIYPLLTDFGGLPLTKKQVHQYLRTTGIDLCLPSSLGNCDLCWKKSDRQLVQAIRNGASGEWWQKWRPNMGASFSGATVRRWTF